MLKINSYLTFNGKCKEAMLFYQSCLGGELSMQTIGETPVANHMPDKMKDCILHSTLIQKDFILMASDIVADVGLIKGNSVSLSLSCSSEEEITKLYNSLSQGGNADHPLENSFWGALFGDLTDKFGNHWLLNFDKNSDL